MSALDSLKFWKKKEPEGMPQWNDLGGEPPKFDEAPPGMETPMPTMPSPMSGPPPSSMPESVQQGSVSPRDVELILARLDTIKVQLENLNNRIAHLERIAEGAQQPKW